MVRCEGRPGAACPDGRNDESVKNSQGDLMLCRACEIFRFPYLATSKSAASLLSLTESSVMQSESTSTAVPAPPKSSSVQPDGMTDKLSSVAQTTTSTWCNRLVQCELLYFVHGVYGKHPVSIIRSSVLDFYRDDEIFVAKQLLVRALDDVTCLDINPYSKNRIGSNKVKTSVDDIMHIFQLVDEGCLQDKIPQFCAVNKSRVPLLADEMSDLASIRLELSQLRQHVEELSSQLSSLCRCKNSSAETMIAKSVVDHVQSESTGDDVLPRQLSDEVVTGCKHHGGAASSVMDIDAIGEDARCSSDSFPRLNLAATTESVPAPVNDMGTDRTFAETVQDNMDDFQKVNNRARQKKTKGNRKIVVGDLKADVPFLGVSKKAVVCISRLNSETTAEEITEYLHAKGINVFSCYGYADKFGRAWSFMRVCVSQTDVNKLFVANLWPDGVVVRPWSFKPRQPSQATNN